MLPLCLTLPRLRLVVNKLRDYQEERISFHLQRQAHTRNAPPGCRCVYCLTTEEIEAEFRAKLKAEQERNGEPPF